MCTWFFIFYFGGGVGSVVVEWWFYLLNVIIVCLIINSRLILALGIFDVAAANSAISFARFAAANASVDSIGRIGSLVDDSQSTVDDALSSLSLLS